MVRFVVAVPPTPLLASVAFAQNPPQSDPQAVALAQQSIAALTNGVAVSDVTLNGTVTWTLGSATDAGTATLFALGSGESRTDLALANGTRTEIRDSSTGMPQGKWVLPDGQQSPKNQFENFRIAITKLLGNLKRETNNETPA